MSCSLSPNFWRENFSRIFCIHYLPHTNRIPRLREELRRVGILDSGILEVRNTVPSKYDEYVLQKEYDKYLCYNKSVVNQALEFRKILIESWYCGYDRILYIEDDIAFLKDVSLLKHIVSNTPEGYDLIQYDKLVSNPLVKEKFDNFMRVKTDSDCFIYPREFCFMGASNNCISRNGMAKIIPVLDNRLIAPDCMPIVVPGLKYASSITNTSVQIVYGNCNNLNIGPVELMHNAYINGGVDYSKYNVPRGYGIGKVYDPDR